MHGHVRSIWCMIAETANLATARNVVKQAGDRNAAGPVRHQRNVGAIKHDLMGTYKTGWCLIGCLSGKQMRTPASELPARMGAEGGAE
jgi:hypothetical protein